MKDYMTLHLIVLAGLFAATACAQLTVERVFYPYTAEGPTFLPPRDRGGSSDGFWPGGLVAVRCRGLKLPEPRIKISTYPLPTEYAGIRVLVGTGPGDEGLPAPILELADLGDYQDIVVQVPWEYKRYRAEGEKLIDGSTGARVFQGEESAEGKIDLGRWNIFFQDTEGYAITRNVANLAWITEQNPAQAGDILEVYAANMGDASGMEGQSPTTGLPTPLPFSTLPDERGILRDGASTVSEYFGLSFPGNQSRRFEASWGLDGPNILYEGSPKATLVPGMVSRYSFRIKLPAVLEPGSRRYGLRAGYWYCHFGFLGLLSIRCTFDIERKGQSDLVPIRVKIP
jgi:uncharacterized protein (TIGR03437 family)